MEDTAIIDLFFARNELAIVETDRKYGNYCYRIADRILDNREDAEETLSDTLLHVWNAIPPERPLLLRQYLGKIARNLAFSRWRRRSAEKRGRESWNWCWTSLPTAFPEARNRRPGWMKRS